MWRIRVYLTWSRRVIKRKLWTQFGVEFFYGVLIKAFHRLMLKTLPNSWHIYFHFSSRRDSSKVHFREREELFYWTFSLPSSSSSSLRSTQTRMPHFTAVQIVSKQVWGLFFKWKSLLHFQGILIDEVECEKKKT